MLLSLKSKKMSEVLNEWLIYKKNSVKISTYQKYDYEIKKYLIPFIGDTKVIKLNNNYIKDFFNNEKIAKLSNSTKNHLLVIIKSVTNYSISKNYLSHFEIRNIYFKRVKNELTYFSKKEQSILEKYLYNNMNLNNLCILIGLYTGLRIGELCCLKKSDINLINNTINVNKTVQRVRNDDKSNYKTKLIIGTPKTRSSIRIVPIPNFISTILKIYLPKEDYYFFTNKNKPKDPRTLEKYFNNLLKKLKISEYNFHSLRHTYATRLREQNNDIKVISELLGHSDWKITQELYIHSSIEYKKSSVNNLSKIWKSKSS